MSTFRVTWTFAENTGSGFNEVYYIDGSTPADAIAAGSGLINARLACLHFLNRLVSIRAAQVDALRVTGLRAINLPGTAGTIAGGVIVGQATPGDAMVHSLAGTTGGSRKLWMRGCPDNFIQRDPASGLDILPPGINSLFQTWYMFLANNNYGLRQIKPPAAGPLSNIKVLSVDGTATPGIALVTCQTAPGYAFPSRVIMSQFSKKDLPALNGRWSLVEAPNLATFKIPYQTPLNSLVNCRTGVVRQESYNTTNIFKAANCQWVYNGTRTTKNPSTHSRGSRRAVRIRASL